MTEVFSAVELPSSYLIILIRTSFYLVGTQTRPVPLTLGLAALAVLVEDPRPGHYVEMEKPLQQEQSAVPSCHESHKQTRTEPL